MMNEVINRIDLIIAVAGSRRISRENLQFLFDKYELSEEEREKVLKHCEEKQIALFDESSVSSEQPEEQTEDSSDPKQEPEQPEGKGFFAKLFGFRDRKKNAECR